MSEYQYYEFQAHDRPLKAREMQALRRASERATITPTRFVNDYDHGEFRGDAEAWVERYFDAFVYLADRGTRRLALRVPRAALGLRLARRYCPGGAAAARAKGAWTVLDFRVDEEVGDRGDRDAHHCLPVLAEVRAGIAAGDARALYLGWLGCVQAGSIGDAVHGPQVPPGLARPSPALEAFATFLRIDPDLLAAAAAKAPAPPRPPSRRTVARRVAALPAKDKDAWLMRWLDGDDPAALLASLRERDARPAGKAQGPAAGDLRRAAARRAAARRRKAVAEPSAGRRRGP